MSRYCVKDLEKAMQKLVDSNVMPGGVLIVNKGGMEVFRGKWGIADGVRRVSAAYDTLYRMASMSKIVTAIAIMQLAEQRKINLEDELCKYLPGYADAKVFPKFVWQTGYYEPDENFPEGLSAQEVIEKAMAMKPIPANRNITIRDILSHSSGIGMGNVGNMVAFDDLNPFEDLAERVQKWEKLPLDFQPGTDTGYSALVGFDILGRIIEVVSGLSLEEYFVKNIFEPLGIEDICFRPNTSQSKKLAKRYFADNGKLYAAPDMENEGMDAVLEIGMSAEHGYFSGAAGLWGSCEEYNKIVKMLAGEGTLDGIQILQPATVRLMHTQAVEKYMEPLAIGQAGCVWGLGVIIFKDASKMNSYAPKDSFGWSGAFGTHALIEPKKQITITFMTSLSNAGGSLSPISQLVEKYVFDIWG